jgi:hypothetical protein
MDLLIALAVGMLAGTHSATWGMYKDAPHEGFELRKYLRSIVLSGAIAPLLVGLAGLSVATPGSLAVLFAVTYVLERAAGEFYKTFLRNEDQSKYFIPMQLAVNGVVVADRRARALAGLGVATTASALLLATIFLQARFQLVPNATLVLLTGSVGGWFSAVGGAWKDAPHEGFELRKFFRSPVLSAFYALVLSAFTDQLVVCALGGLGLTIATLETYKTFFFPNKPRGKFAGKPVTSPAMLEKRKAFVPVYVAISALVVWAILYR